MNAPADHLAAFGLEQDPFVDQSADHFFYADPALMQRLDLLQHLTQFGDMLLLVSGPPGSGKTALLRQFRLRANDNWRLCQLSGSQITTPRVLRAQLGECFGIDPEQADFGSRLMAHCEGLQQTARLGVLVIDDAHALPDSVLAALLTLGGTPRETVARLRILFFAEPGLEERLVKGGFQDPRQPLVHGLEMPLFDERQSAAYLMYRLAVAGYSGDSPFSSTQVRAMHKAAGGVPARLNALAREQLIALARKRGGRPRPSGGEETSRGRQLAWGIVSAAVAVLGLGGAWLWWQGREAEPPLVEAEVPLALPEAPRPVLEPESPPPSEEVPREMPDQGAPAEASPLPEEAPALAGAGSLESPPQVEKARPQPAEPSPAAPPAKAGEEARQVVASEARPEPPPAAEAVPPSPGKEAARAVLEAPAGEVAKPVAAPAEAPPAPPPPKDWISAQPPGHYTLQLLGVSREASARAFVKRHGLGGQAHVFRARRKGRDWFVVIYGSYPSKAEAQAALRRLPAAVRKGGPWPRRFREIQAERVHS